MVNQQCLQRQVGRSLDLFVPLPSGATLDKSPFFASTINLILLSGLLRMRLPTWLEALAVTPKFSHSQSES